MRDFSAASVVVAERLVAEMAERFVVVVDESKLVTRLGDFGVPVEVMEARIRAAAGGGR